MVLQKKKRKQEHAAESYLLSSVVLKNEFVKA